MAKTVLGKCPNCGENVVIGKYGPNCSAKCGMRFGYAMGRRLSDQEVETLLAGEHILLRNLTNKEGTEYNAYLTPNGVQEYSYEKDGETKSGIQWKFDFEFPEDDELPEEEPPFGNIDIDDSELPFN
ncbi:hypothetical protein [Butyrivibrio sp. INlla14]|uniref:hypothetical protein n=1 Tax=Butyrivibrio sp. INlla14 TaxID=1520808 RepID=UPI0008767CE9|nr:hypothetical protein [Butyrivibrio sp. INlla14]SCY11122.1 DNA topoisomerase-3 [Butyrivibrio sp. INlla14]